MKKTIFILLTVMISLGAGCIAPADDSDTEVGGRYRKVTVSGDLLANFNSASSSGPVVVCQPSGAYEMELYFDAQGGELFGYKNYFWLTDYDCVAFNGAQGGDCQTSLSAEVMAKRQFDVKAELDLSATDLEAGFDGEVFFMLKGTPSLPPVEVIYLCGGKETTKTDPGALTQIFYPFNNRENLQWSFPTAIGQIYEEEPTTAYSLGNMNYLSSVKVEQEWVDFIGH